LSTTVTLRKNLTRVIRQGHPWIFRDALRAAPPAPGEVVTVADARGRFVARGLAEAGPIGVRVFLTRDAPLDGALLARRVRAASVLRERVVPPETTAYRLLHGEGDRLPGVVCDLYGAHAVLQLDGEAAGAWRDEIVAALTPVLDARGVANLLHRHGRGRSRTVSALRGAAPSGPIEVRECGLRLVADLTRGQKTGLFLDHRDSRRRVRELAGGCRVLNLFGYTGGFSVAAGLGGARSVATVDSAAPALDLAAASWAANDLDPADHRAHVTSVQRFLDAAAARDERWDLIVSDPPSYAPSQQKVPAALDAYRALHRAALGRLAPRGRLLAASCSSHVRRREFERTLKDAAREAGRPLRIRERWGAAPDHPTLAVFPEGRYLKVLLARAVD